MPAVDPAVADRARTLHFGTLVIDGLQAAPMTPEHFARLRKAGIRIVNYTAVRVTSDFAQASLDVAAFLRGGLAPGARAGVRCFVTAATHHDRRPEREDPR